MSDRGAPEGPAVPILRVFDHDKAMEFYVGYLGFSVDWLHRFHDHSPLYAQVSRGRTVLHLSEHHGDASPGGAALIPVRDLQTLHAELHSRPYDYANPGVEDEDWGRVMVVIDPFHNRLVFHQPVDSDWRDRMTEQAAVEVRDNPEEHRFEAFVDGELAGFTAYDRGDGTILIVHAEVDDAFEGKGVGSAMVRQVLDLLRAESGVKVSVVCPFVSAWIRRHPDYQDLTRR